MNWTTRSLQFRFLVGSAAGLLLISFVYAAFALTIQREVQSRFASGWLERELDFYMADVEDSKGEYHFHHLRNKLRWGIYTLLAFNDKGQLLWNAGDLPEFADHLDPGWVTSPGLHRIVSDELIPGSRDAEGAVLLPGTQQFSQYSYFVQVKHYSGNGSTQVPVYMVVIDTMPREHAEKAYFWVVMRNVTLINLLILLPLIWYVARWSLLPIARLARAVRQLENGEGQRLDFVPPVELSRLVNNLNLLLLQQRKQMERYRNTLGDLAHSIKTPLAVLQSSLQTLRSQPEEIHDQAPLLQEQISRIDQQIGYYLHRATLKRDMGLGQQQLDVSDMATPLCNALRKVYDRKGVVLNLLCPPGLMFHGEKTDFQEMVGNVIENACKYCLEYVDVICYEQHGCLVIEVCDDGPGVPESRRQQILQRGARADTLKPGQGIGLAVVVDIIESYDGEMIIDQSALLGGARFLLRFPYTRRRG